MQDLIPDDLFFGGGRDRHLVADILPTLGKFRRTAAFQSLAARPKSGKTNLF